MRIAPAAAVVVLQFTLFVFGLRSPASMLTASLLSSVVVLASLGDFESMAKSLSKAGLEATAPASVMGRSGVKHEFSLAIQLQSAQPKVVVDTALSVNEVDEMKVLAFYVKVFDVAPEKAILAVSPRLSERGRALAKEYRIMVLENEAPRKLVPMVADVVEKIMREPWKI